MSDEEILKEARKNSRLRRFVNFESIEEAKEIKNDSNSSFQDDSNHKAEINRRFQELRKKHINLNVDSEAEEFIQKLRDIGEYNRWSLKLIQKWLTLFYHGKNIFF